MNWELVGIIVFSAVILAGWLFASGAVARHEIEQAHLRRAEREVQLAALQCAAEPRAARRDAA